MMYQMRRRRRFPVTAWLVPLCVALVVVISMIVDYTHEHVHVSVFGQSVDTLSVRQVMVEPIEVATSSKPTYTVNGHRQIVQMMKLLGQAKPLHKTADAESAKMGQMIDNLYIELDAGTWHIVLFKSTGPHQVLVDYKNQLFTADEALLTTLKQPPAK